MEEVNDQIDRLNIALQQVMDEIANNSIDRVPRMSITNSNWLDHSSENSSLDIPDDLERRLEKILLQLDRSNMVIEDFYSEKFRELFKVNLTKAEVKSLISNLNSLLTGHSCVIGLGNESYELNLHPSESVIDNREITVIENSIMDCGHDITKMRREIALDLEKKMQQKKNAYLEKARASFESQLEEIDKLKQQYVDKLKDLVLFNNQLEKKEKKLELKELTIQKDLNDGILPEDLENKLKHLVSICENADYEEKSKIALKIEQLKNKITNMRVEKVISDSKQTSSVLSRVVKAMEREVSFDEKQRKKLLEKYTESHQIDENNETEKLGISTLKKQEENFKIYMENARNRIKKKEAELLQKEKNLAEKFLGMPGNKDLIDLMKNSLEKLNREREENEREREILEREKLDIVNLNEKIMKIWNSLENFKKGKHYEESHNLREQITSLNIDPRGLGF